MHSRKTIIAVLLLSAAAFALFVLTYERAVRHEAEEDVAEHARIVANALWNYNKQSVSEYLALACRANNYENLSVRDTAGAEFFSVRVEAESRLQDLLARLGLMGRFPLSTDIVYKGQKIGVIEVTQRSRAIYTEAVVLVGLVLVLVIFFLVLRLLRSRKVLERKVLERTSELSDANASLLKEVADRIEAEKGMRVSEEKYRTLVENLGIGVSLISPDMRVLATNRQMRQWFSGLADSTQPACFAAFNLPPRDSPCASCPVEKTLVDGQRHEVVTQALRGGEDRHYRIVSTPIKDPEGNIVSAIELLEDITVQMAAEQEKQRLFARLQQAQKMEAIGTLAGGIAHDFNNLLFPIIGYVEMLLMKMPEREVVVEKLGAVLAAAQRARELVHQILTIARRTQEPARVVSLSRVVSEVAKLARSTIPTTIDIRLALTPSKVLVSADPTQLHQVILNLCTNAFHAMRDKGGVLEISLMETELDTEDGSNLPPGPYALLLVSDSGTGMPPEVADRVFEPYFTTKESGQGTGLGLSVVHGIVAKLGGEIRIITEPEKGTTVAVYLPVAADAQEESPAPDEGPLALGNEHLLLVDDEPEVLKMIKEMVESLGYRVTARSTSTQALEAFRENPESFDAVITDMTMPHMTGADLAAKLLSIRPEIPVVLCTGYSDSIDEAKAGLLGFAAYLIKPVAVRTMAETLARVFKRG